MRQPRSPACVLTKGRVWEEQAPGWGHPGPAGAGEFLLLLCKLSSPPAHPGEEQSWPSFCSELPLVSTLLPGGRSLPC